MIKAIVFDAYGTLYDTQSVAGATEAAFPGHGEYITQVWRLKQLEYSWLRSLMGRYEDFRTTPGLPQLHLGNAWAGGPNLRCSTGLSTPTTRCLRIPKRRRHSDGWRTTGWRSCPTAVPDMLDALVRNSGLDGTLEAVISVDARKVYKPDPRAYELVQERLGVRPEEVAFISSNGFDVAGAKSFGFKVARIERVTPAALQQEMASGAPIGPATDVSRVADPDRGAWLHPGCRGGFAARAAGMDFNARYMKVEDRPRPRIGDPRSGVQRFTS